MSNLYLCGTYALSLLDEGAIEHAALSEQQRFDAPLCTLSDISRRIAERHLPTGDVQVFVPEGARHAQSSSIRRFIRKQPFPAGSFYYLGEGVFAESHESFFARIASRLPLAQAIRLGMEFCSAYSTLPSIPYQQFLTELADSTLMPIPPDDWGISYEHALYLANRGFVQRPAPTTAARIRQYVAGAYSRKSSASRAANHLVDGFKSPMEARLYLLLQLPFRLGGSALPTVVNRQFNVGPEAARLLGRDHYELDLYVPSARYGIEYDGRFDHEDDRQSSFDRKKRYFLEREGIRIISLDRHQARNRQLLEQYVNDIWEASGLRKRLTIDETRYNRIRDMLWCDLFDYGADLYRPQRPARSISVRDSRRGHHAQSAIYR